MLQNLKIKIKSAIKKYGLFRFSEEYVFQLNRDIKCFKKLQKKYGKYITNSYNMPTTTPKEVNKVWFCWLQGIENAPPMVKACYESVKRNFKDKEVVILTEENINNYVEFPDFIMKKYKDGIISRTHFSDLLRMQLLITHGGVWVDSTCFITDNIPKYVEENSIFMFGNDYRRDITSNISSWFIKSVPNHPLLLTLRDVLFAYWKNENKLKHYFLFHFFVTMIMNKYPEIYADMSFVSNINPHVLQFRYIFKEFNEKDFEHIKRTCFIHKLSYKFDLSQQSNYGQGKTFYEYIVDGKCK